jgi:hypothetical protein
MGEIGGRLTVITCNETTDVPFIAELTRPSARLAVYVPLTYYGNRPDALNASCGSAARPAGGGLAVYAQA